jgi:predicted Zn-dependent peptidase
MKRGLRLPAQVTIQPSKEVTLKGIERITTRDIPIYLVSGGNEPVFKLELSFRAGKLFERQRHAASTTASIMTEGTRKMTSPVIAEELEYYGATVRCYTSPDTLTLSVHAMTKFAAPVLEIIRDIILEPVFPQDELSLYQKKKVQRYKMGQMQNEYQANRAFSEFVFGSSHPYGYTATPENVMALTTDSLREHHQILGKSCLDVFLAGDTRDRLIDKVEALLLDLPEGELRKAPEKPPVQQSGKHHLPGPQPHQTSVRIGKQIISRKHRDYPGLFLLNTILGGYHGSRLIRNLREEKGLTYGVQSNLESLLESTCFIVSTDANLESRDRVVDEIYQEIALLQTKQVGIREMEMVKNYICGNFLMQIDGPFNVVDTIKPLVLHKLPLTYFEEFITQLRKVSAKKVKSLAENYLRKEEMVEVVVGY